MGVCDEMEITFISLVLPWVQNDFGLSKYLWSSTNYLTKMIWTGPKYFGQSKIILNL